MKKFIFNLTIFLIYSFLIYLIALFIWGNFAPNVLKPNLKYPIGSIGNLNTRLKEVIRLGDLTLKPLRTRATKHSI